MKLDLSTGCLVTVWQSELDRRIAAVRSLLKEKNAGLFMAVCPMKGGYRKYLTGTDGPGRPSEGAILIGRTGNVITVNGGTLVPRGALGERNYAMAGGVEGDAFSGYGSTEGFSADILEEMLGGSKILAVANTMFLRADLYEYLKENLPEVQLLDVSEEMDKIRSIKSEAEIGIFKANCRAVDKLFGGAGIYINPLKYEREIVTDLRYAAYRLGAGGVDHQIATPVQLTSGKDGAPKETGVLCYPGRKVEFGDRVNLKMYAIGNDGYYAGMARSYVLGEPSEDTKKLWDTAVKAQDLAVSLLRPGITVKAVAERINEFLENEGYLPDRHTMIHGIGVSVQENPQVFDNAPMTVEENMVFYIGPTVDNGASQDLSIGDIYVVGKEETVRLTTFPRELIRLY